MAQDKVSTSWPIIHGSQRRSGARSSCWNHASTALSISLNSLGGSRSYESAHSNTGSKKISSLYCLNYQTDSLVIIAAQAYGSFGFIARNNLHRLVMPPLSRRLHRRSQDTHSLLPHPLRRPIHPPRRKGWDRCPLLPVLELVFRHRCTKI